MISAQTVKTLRERTGSGMMECKRALESTNGDIDKAVELLRTKGAAQADKKASRVAAEGRISIAQSDGVYAMLETNCETDFVAKSPDFIDFSNSVLNAILNSNASNVDQLLESNCDIENTRRDLIAKIGENITVRRFAKVKQTGTIGFYLHDNNIGVMTDVVCGDSETALEIAKDLSMHITAFNPGAIDESNLDQQVLEAEKRILKQQALDSGKPEEIAQKMIVGRIKKFVDENTLLGQKFVKNQDISVAEHLKQNKAQVASFYRFKVGEGIEKRQEDFVSEVMSQVKKV